jgi:hypothetical protein
VRIQRKPEEGYSSFPCKIWHFALKNWDFSIVCKIALVATGVETESLAGRGSPGDCRQILHGKDEYPKLHFVWEPYVNAGADKLESPYLSHLIQDPKRRRTFSFSTPGCRTSAQNGEGVQGKRESAPKYTTG